MCSSACSLKSENPETEEPVSDEETPASAPVSQSEPEETTGSVPSIPAKPATRAKDNQDNPEEENAKPSNDDTTVVSLDSFRKK